MRLNQKITFVAISLLFAGCASTVKHDHSRGSVVALDTDSTAHVCMSANAVQVGEQLDTFKITCKKNKAPASKAKETYEATTCQKDFLGKVEVTELVDEHFIKVRPKTVLSLSEGLVVEKN